MPLVGIGTPPTPFSPASVPLPPETGGRGHTSLRLGGWGESQFQRGAYTVVLFICTYFVISYSVSSTQELSLGEQCSCCFLNKQKWCKLWCLCSILYSVARVNSSGGELKLVNHTSQNSSRDISLSYVYSLFLPWLSPPKIRMAPGYRWPAHPPPPHQSTLTSRPAQVSTFSHPAEEQIRAVVSKRTRK